MDLVSGTPLWPLLTGLPAVYPPLTQPAQCEVAVIGAGVSGALVAHALSGAGVDVIVVDRRDVASGSTAASTALLTWELDVELAALAKSIGADRAAAAYRASHRTIGTIESLVRGLPDDCGFARRPSLYLALRRSHAKRLQREVACRQECGLPSEFWDRKRLARESAFSGAGAIWSEDTAEIDPYRFTHALLDQAAEQGARIFDRTEIVKEARRGAGIVLTSSRGSTIRAQRVVLAQGYEIPRPLRHDLVSLSSTFVVATEPAGAVPGWPERCLVWESSRPYVYLRGTSDGRILIGGADERFRSARRRDRHLPKKALQLWNRFQHLLPGVATEPAFAWTGTFAESPDGLPFIGARAGEPNRLFALGYGGNGITFGALAAEIIRNICQGVPDAERDLFRIDR